jgi:hypothetical protein
VQYGIKSLRLKARDYSKKIVLTSTMHQYRVGKNECELMQIYKRDSISVQTSAQK